jgi:ADP-heptose:LPS heptosyltransferase
LLQDGQLAEGWDLYLQRWAAPNFRDAVRFTDRPSWQGGLAELEGKRLLIWREQGVGDEITYCSALPELLKAKAEITLECTPKLVSLFQRSFPEIRVVAEDSKSDAERQDFDLHCPMGDLFVRLRRKIEGFETTPSPYLFADPERVQIWRERLAQLGPGRKIGFGWRSTYVTRARLKHFFKDLSPWRPLFTQPETQFISLQPGDVTKELDEVEAAFGCRIHRFPELDLYNDMDELAALMTALDLVISNGSANVILASALGRPVWMFFLAHSGWDLLGTGNRMPWLKSLDIFARTWNESWNGVIQRMAQRLSSGKV